MQQLLEKAGYEIVPFTEGADVYLINTCTVTNIADRKIPTDAAQGKKNEPGCDRGSCRMLCTGRHRKTQRRQRG